MKIALAFVMLLTVGASGQQSQEFAGGIYGIVVGTDGQPAKGVRLSALWNCPSSCSLWMEDTLSNQAGEYRFQHLLLGQKYSVFSRMAEKEYPQFSPPPRRNVELTVDHPDAELRIDLPPKPGILMIHLTDRTTGRVIPRVLLKVKVPDAPDSRWSELWADGSDCLFYPDCAIPVPPDKQVLVHVSSVGFREWDESAVKGMPLLIHSGARLTWDIQLTPLPH